MYTMFFKRKCKDSTAKFQINPGISLELLSFQYLNLIAKDHNCSYKIGDTALTEKPDIPDSKKNVLNKCRKIN